jgi:hypothetical protein
MAVSLRTTWISRIAAAALNRLLATVAPRNAETEVPWLSVPSALTTSVRTTRTAVTQASSQQIHQAITARGSSERDRPGPSPEGSADNVTASGRLVGDPESGPDARHASTVIQYGNQQKITGTIHPPMDHHWPSRCGSHKPALRLILKNQIKNVTMSGSSKIPASWPREVASPEPPRRRRKRRIWIPATTPNNPTTTPPIRATDVGMIAFEGGGR